MVQERLAPIFATARDRASYLFDLLRSMLEMNTSPVMRLTQNFEQHAAWLGGIEDALDELLREIRMIKD